MSKNKLAKFADMATYPHVFEVPYAILDTGEFPGRGQWHTFFGNTNPIVLELGCGRGEYTVGLARRYPDMNFIGVDIKGSRMWSGATESLQEGLKNVAFLRTSIEFIDHFFAPEEVSALWLTFSDPQMRKVNKRLTGTRFLARYAKFLKADGLVHVKTDSNFLYTYTRLMLEHNGISPVVIVEDIDAVNPTLPQDLVDILQIQTYYESQWRGRGKTIKYLAFKLPPKVLEEPDVEIEMDDYRSYNRHKRSELSTSK
ncbi:MAG: tRNA (guanosine(46)-N7)-methyltransferase TrmB [Bacteroidales bacterium]|nr:tRNA (guanosine(46)-N7)-methyltransferase TrmB [Bacteroidales bacterium]